MLIHEASIACQKHVQRHIRAAIEAKARELNSKYGQACLNLNP